MNRLCGLLALSAFACSLARAEVFGGGPGGSIPITVSNGHSTNWGQMHSTIVVNRPDVFIFQLNSVTLRGLNHRFLSAMEIYLSNAQYAMHLYYPGFESTAAVNGDITFRVGTQFPTLNERSTQVNSLPTGTYNPSVVMPDASIGRGNFDGFNQTSLTSGWTLSFYNYDRNSAGRLGSWSFDATVGVVPEPASLSALAIGAFVVARRRRAR